MACYPKSQILDAYCAYCASCLDAVLLYKAHSDELYYLECTRVFYRLLSIFLIVSLAVRVKKRGAILWITSAGTSNWSLVATFNAESICSKPVSSTSFRWFLHSLLNILSLKFYIDVSQTSLGKFQLLTIVRFDALNQASLSEPLWLIKMINGYRTQSV